MRTWHWSSRRLTPPADKRTGFREPVLLVNAERQQRSNRETTEGRVSCCLSVVSLLSFCCFSLYFKLPMARPDSLADHAANQLAFIRDTMVRAGRFTAVSGAGTVGTGIIGSIAAVLAPRAATPEQWLAVWLVAAAAAIVVSLGAMARKASRSGQSLRAGPARTFALAFAPPLAAGALLTAALASAGA